MALTSTQRGAKKRQENRDKGLERLYIPEIWATPDQNKEIQKEFALLISRIIKIPA